MPAWWRAACIKPGELGEALHREPLNAGDVPCPRRAVPRPVPAGADRWGVLGSGIKHYRSLGSYSAFRRRHVSVARPDLDCLPEKTAALNRWGEHLLAAVAGKRRLAGAAGIASQLARHARGS
jgi:hypothetical protein